MPVWQPLLHLPHLSTGPPGTPGADGVRGCWAFQGDVASAPCPPPPPAARSLWAFEQTPPPPRLCGGSLEDVPRSRPRRPEEVWAGGPDALWPALALPWAPCTRRGGDVTVIWWFLCGSGVFCSSSRCSTLWALTSAFQVPARALASLTQVTVELPGVIFSLLRPSLCSRQDKE